MTPPQTKADEPPLSQCQGYRILHLESENDKLKYALRWLDSYYDKFHGVYLDEDDLDEADLDMLEYVRKVLR